MLNQLNTEKQVLVPNSGQNSIGVFPTIIIISIVITIISIIIIVIIIVIFNLLLPHLRIEVYDWDADGGHDFIGDCTTTLEELAQGEGFQIIQVC